MKEMKNIVVGRFLLICFSLALVPLDLFHDHHWDSEICKKEDHHFAYHSIDCDLADFYMAKHLKQDVQAFSSVSVLLSEFLTLQKQELFAKEPQQLQLRGPPELS